MRKIRVVGLTGQTGAGKTTVCDVIRSRGIPVVDADEVSRDVVASGKKCLADLALAFSITILNADGTLNRKRLASLVFDDKKKLQKLDKIIFPYILEEVGARIDALDRAGKNPVVLIDAPTLFESGADSICDKVIAVIAPENQRLNRIMIRDRISDMDARKRMSAQHDDAFYTSRANYIIENGEDEMQLRLKTLDTIEQMKRDLNLR